MNGNNGIEDNNTQAKKNQIEANQDKNIKINDNEHQAIFCSLCYSLSSINIIQENEEIFIELTCHNSHTEKLTLKNFFNTYKNYFLKKCQICNINININKLLYCFHCKEIFCIKCKDIHYSKLNKKNTNEHLIRRLILKEQKCIKHKFKLNEYYCVTCEKYLCRECLPYAHINHNIINLYLVNEHKNELKALIEKEEKINNNNLNEFNKMIVNAKNKFRDIYNYEKTISRRKKNIINTY